MAYTDNDLAMERQYEREERSRMGCRCGGDMPGRCPGPMHCPMCVVPDHADDEVDADAQAEADHAFEERWRCGEVR